jgi:hypothetical protein
VAGPAGFEVTELCLLPLPAETGAAGGGIAAASAAFWLGFLRALLTRRARDALRTTLDPSSLRPPPRPTPLSIAVEALNGFPSATALLGDSILDLGIAVDGAGKWSRSGS